MRGKDYLIIVSLFGLVCDLKSASVPGSSMGAGNGEFIKHSPNGLFIVIPLAFIIISFLTYFRFKMLMLVNKSHDKAGQVIFKSRSVDQFWNENEMLNFGIKTFYDYYKIFLDNDSSRLNDIADEKLLLILKNNLSNNKLIGNKSNYYFKLRHKKIIFANDNEDESLDSFKMYFSGIASVELIRKNETGILISEFVNENINSIFSFQRYEKKWKLVKVENDITKTDFYIL